MQPTLSRLSFNAPYLPPPPPIFSVLLPPRSDHVVVELSVTPLAPGPLRIEGITVSMGNATKLFRVGDKGQVRPMDHPH